MVPFSIAFLVPFAIGTFDPALTAWATWLSLALPVAAWSLGRRDWALGALAGWTLLVLRPAPPPAWSWPSGVRSQQVEVRGLVERCYSGVGSKMTRIVLRSGPEVLVPGDLLGPLPGTEILARGRLEPSGRQVRVAHADAVEVVRTPSALAPEAVQEKLRRGLLERVKKGLSPEGQDVVSALLLGVRLPRGETRDRLARTGTIHLLAISGLHISVMLGLFRRVIGPRVAVTLGLLVVYAAITGFQSPVGRALLMATGTLLSRGLLRPDRPRRWFFLAMTLQLAWNPKSAEHAGFLLSFSAYGGIVFLAAPILEARNRDPLRRLIEAERWGRSRRRVGEGLLVSWAAFAGSLPVTVLLFGRMTPVAIPGTLLLAPALPLLLALSLVLAVVPGFPPATHAVDFLVALIGMGVSLLDRIPGGSLDVVPPCALAFVLYGVALAWFLRPTQHGVIPRRRWIAVALGSASLLVLGIREPPGVYLLNAGRGTAILVSDHRNNVLLDCGPATARVSDQVLRQGISKLDLVLISHPHEDHQGGLDEVLRRVTVRCVQGTPEGPDVSHLMGTSPAAGITILWPPADSGALSTNDRSVVAVVQLSGRRLLSLGDLETTGLNRLMAGTSLPSVDVLVFPHHGAANGRTLDLFLATLPDRAWLPARPGFAQPSTLLTATWLGIPVDTSYGRRLPKLLGDSP